MSPFPLPCCLGYSLDTLNHAVARISTPNTSEAISQGKTIEPETDLPRATMQRPEVHVLEISVQCKKEGQRAYVSKGELLEVDVLATLVCPGTTVEWP